MKRSFQRLVFGLFAVFALALLAAACGDDEETGTGEQAKFDGAIKIGILADLSGPLGGNPNLTSTIRGFEVGVKDINDGGGVKVADKRYEIQIIKVDSQSNPVAAVAGATQLVAAGVLGSAINTCAFFPQAYAQFKAPGNIMTWTNCPPGLNLLDKDVPGIYEGVEKNPLLFGAIDFTLPILAGWLNQVKQTDPTIKSLAFLADDTNLGKAQGAVMPAAAQLAGLEFKGATYFPAGTTDASTFLTTVKAQNADLVYMSASGNLDSPRQFIQLGVAPRLMVPGLRPFDMTTIGSIGSTKVYMMDWRLPYHKEVAPKEFQDEVAKLGTLDGGGSVQVGFAIAFYDFAYLLKQAIEKAQTTTDAAAVAKAMVGLKVDSFMGGEVIMEADHAARGTTGMILTTTDEFKVYVFENARTDKPIDTFTVKR